ncbi:hypothetical protein [Agromyces sp. GXS1127]|uniref:hypothetical protein n=1 Tax=Agromyces sp. GXS1127 TaxID=3424181 RepID=UPI003D31FC75
MFSELGSGAGPLGAVSEDVRVSGIARVDDAATAVAKRIASSRGDPAWAVVELVDRIEDPTPLPWSAGADHRWRVGYRTTVVDSRGDVDEPLGLIWVDDDAREANGMLLSADRS